MADLGLGDALDDALLKISASLPAPSRAQAEQACQRVYIDASCWGHAPDVTANLETIQQALWQERRLHVRYLADDGSQHVWLLEPYGLVSKAGDWYLVGACQQTYGAYRIARMQMVCLSEERFVRAADFDLAVYWSDYCAQIELNVEQQAARRTFTGRQRSWRRSGTTKKTHIKKTVFNSGIAQPRVLPASRQAATKKSNFAVRRGLDVAPQKKRAFPTSRKKTLFTRIKKTGFTGSQKNANFPHFPASWLCA
jgi:predicted DNA-binding transcriptional regulator YafY